MTHSSFDLQNKCKEKIIKKLRRIFSGKAGCFYDRRTLLEKMEIMVENDDDMDLKSSRIGQEA